MRSDDALTTLTTSEAAVRGLLRRVGDAVDGVVVRSTELEGEIGEQEAPVTVRVTVSPPLGKLASSSPVIRPSQERYPPTLSGPSTVATESSRSTIVVTADSSTTSATWAWC